MFSPASRSVREEIMQNVLGLQAAETPAYDASIFDPETLSEDDTAIFSDLQDLEEYLNLYISHPYDPALLNFVDYSQELSADDLSSVLSILSPADPATRHILHKIHGLQNLLPELKAIKCSHPGLVGQRDDLLAVADLEIKQTLLNLWDERKLRMANSASIFGIRSVPAANRSAHLHASPLVMSAIVLTAVIHAVMGVSRKNCNFVLSSIRAIVSMALKMEVYRSPDFVRQHTSDIPTTLPTVLHRLNLRPQFDLYACCTKCKKLYPYRTKEQHLLPTLCSAKKSDGNTCDAELSTTHRRGTRTRQKPVSTYSHMRFETWISELLMREGVEDLLESTRPNPNPGDATKDVWDAPLLKTFSEALQPSFMDSPADKLNLVMMLHFDFFNPLENKEAGKKRSVGCFFMICLNFPPDVRYNPANAYLVSVVPGPDEAHFDQLNNFVKPIVDDMIEVYAPGIRVSRTRKHPHGRRVRAGIAIKSMDIPAARGATGFASHAHDCLCHLCGIRRAQMDSISLRPFQLRTIETHRRQVQLWENAGSEKEQKKVYAQYGVRGTDWLRFPWWNPFESVVVGPMHWTKNVLDKQLRKNMEWSWDVPSGLPLEIPTTVPHISELEFQWGSAAILCLDEKDFTNAKLTAPLLHFMCQQRNIFEAGLSRNRLINELNNWRKQVGLISDNGERTLYVTTKFGDGGRVGVLRAQYYVSKHPPASPSTISQNALVSELRTICADLRLDASGQKEELIQRLQLYYKNVRVPDRSDSTSIAKQAKRDKVSLLGFEVLDEVKHDMERTILPSWIKRPPINFATVNHGKLQSEEYKSLALVPFTLTLVRLWGQNDSTMVPLRERLDNFLHLMLAVRILAFQSLTELDISAFELHYEAYLGGLKSLYPSCTFNTNQHLGLHLPHFMRSLGPSTRWSESTCEQYIGNFQHMTTNYKFGDLEQTLHREFVMAGRLKGMLDSENFTQMLGDFGRIIEDFMQQHLPNQVRQAWQVAHSVAPTIMDPNVFNALNAWASARSTRSFPRRLFLCSKIATGNVVYAPYSESNGDSAVLFSPPTLPQTLLAGRIEFILQEPELPATDDSTTQKARLVLIVRPFRPLTPEDASHDPYLNNSIIGANGAGLAQLYYNELEDTTYLIEPRDLVAHVAVCLYSDPEGVLSQSAIAVLSFDLKHKRFA